MFKYYIFNIDNKNEYLGTIELESESEFGSYTLVEYPSEIPENKCYCFNTETQKWDILIDDYRGKVIYNNTNSLIKETIYFVGSIKENYTTVTPPDNENIYTFDGTQWNKFTPEVVVPTLEQLKHIKTLNLLSGFRSYISMRFDDAAIVAINNAAHMNGPKGCAVQEWINSLWYPLYYTLTDSISTATDKETLESVNIDPKQHGEPPYSMREINEEIERLKQANDLLASLTRDNAFKSIPLDNDATALKIAAIAPEWHSGITYESGMIVNYNNQAYRVIQTVTSLEHQTPATEGMLAIYRPLVLTATGTIDDPITFISGMDVDNGKYYTFNGKVYLAKADMKPCVWNPDSGIWQWEVVK